MVLTYFLNILRVVRDFGFFSVELIYFVGRYVLRYFQFLVYIAQWLVFFVQKIIEAAGKLYDILGIAQFAVKVQLVNDSVITTLRGVEQWVPFSNKAGTILYTLKSIVFGILIESFTFLSITLQAFPFVLLYALAVVIYKVIGEPSLSLAENPQDFYNNVNVVFFGTVSSVNVGAGFVNFFLIIFNVLNMPLRVIAGGFFQVITLVIGAGFDYNPISGIPRDLQEYKPSNPELASHAIAHRQLETLTGTSGVNSLNTYTNEVYVTPNYDVIVTALVSIETPFILGLAVFFELILFLTELWLTVFGPIIGIIVDLITDIGSLGCCFVTAEAFGFCLVDFILRIVNIFVRLVLRFIPGIDDISRDLLDANPVKSVPGAPCACAKKLPQVPTCRAATYTCETLGSGNAQKYVSYRITYPSDDDSEAKSQMWRSGVDRSVVCREYIQSSNGQRKLRDNDSECKIQCYKGISDSWKFKVCGASKKYLGACDRTIPPSLRSKHLQKYLKLPIVSKDERHELLLQEQKPQITVKATKEPVKSTKFIADLSKVKEFIADMEKIDVPGFDCDIDKADQSFEMWFLRATCIGVRFLYSRPWILTIQNLLDLKIEVPHIRSLVESGQEGKPTLLRLTEMFDVHVKWYNETFNKRSLLVEHGQKIHDLASNISLNLHSLKKNFMEDSTSKGLEWKQSRNLRGSRQLATTNLQTGVFQSNGPRCDYLCPDGITCVAVVDAPKCPIPSGNWTSGTVIRTTFHTFTVMSVGIDIEQSITKIIDCWFGYVRNPTIYPGSFASVVDILLNDNEDSYIWCFPFIPSLPYLPILTWSLEKYVEAECGTSALLLESQVQALQKCICPAYDVTGTFDYTTPWTPFSYEFIRVRTYNTWKQISYLLNLFPPVHFFWNCVYGFVQFFFPAQTEWLAFLDPSTTQSSWFCFVMYIGYLLWSCVFLFFPLYAALYLYWDFFMNYKDKTKPKGLIIRIKDWLLDPWYAFTEYLTIQNQVKKTEQVVTYLDTKRKKRRIYIRPLM